MIDAESLKNERNFVNYINKLKEMRSELIILIAANNTPAGGSAMTQEFTKFFRESLGLGVDLYDKFRLAYAVCINRGMVLGEKIGRNRQENLEVKILGDNNFLIQMISAGFEGNPRRNVGIVEVNGKNVSQNSRGLNFVVLDATTLELVDSCVVDTFVDEFVCIRKDDAQNFLKEYMDAHPGVTLISLRLPHFPTQNFSPYEAYYKSVGLADGMNLGYVFSHLGELIESKKCSLTEFYSNLRDIEEVLSSPQSYKDMYGVRKFFDYRGHLVNTIGGIRVTCNQPRTPKRSVFLIGPCHIFGISAADEHTISSFLQKNFNEKASAEEFIVYNYGYYLMSGRETFDSEYKILQSLPVKRGDIVISLWDSPLGGVTCDLSNAAKRPHNYGEVFFCVDHYSPAGYRLMADKLFDFIKEHNFFKNAATNDKIVNSVSGNYEKFTPNFLNELQNYKVSLRKIYDKIKPRIGAIVMNCNPFTLGHRYLIEKSLALCDRLIIFVVEEDKSYFPFEDRLQLVKKGVSDLKNIIVVPSGKFIISTLTFTEYFNKSEMQNVSVDTSLDLTIFAKEIAPTLGINIRFVGEEPLDRVTAQYNETMHSILAQYNIEVEEIPRLKIDGTVVSASLVRELLQNKDWDKIENFVPRCTLEYLKQQAT